MARREPAIALDRAALLGLRSEGVNILLLSLSRCSIGVAVVEETIQ